MIRSAPFLCSCRRTLRLARPSHTPPANVAQALCLPCRDFRFADPCRASRHVCAAVTLCRRKRRQECPVQRAPRQAQVPAPRHCTQELLREIARGNVLHVNFTITMLDEKPARLLEPRAPRPALRLAALRKLSDAGIAVGVFANPVMPGLTDGERHLDRLAKTARNAGALWFDGAPLFLMPSAQKVFFPLLEREFPELVAGYRELYARSAFLDGGYKGRVANIRERYELEAEPIGYRPELWDGEEQGELFPLQ